MDVTSRMSDMIVGKGDRIHVADSLLEECQREFDKIRPAEYRDYAFIPSPGIFEGDEAFLRDMERIYEQTEPEVLVIKIDEIFHYVRNFIDAFKDKSNWVDQITHPVKDLIIVSHVNWRGELIIELDMCQPAVITYEYLEEKKDWFRLSDNLLKPRPKGSEGNEIPLTVHIRGCRLGTKEAYPYLEKLRKAFGNQVQVKAEKYDLFAGRRNGLLIEFMCYHFGISRPRWLTREDAIKQFVKEDFPYIDNKKIPREQWLQWFDGLRGWPPEGAPEWVMPLNPNIRLPPALPRSELHLPAQFRYVHNYLYPKFQHVQLGQEPLSDKERKRIIREDVECTDPRFRGAYPYYLRLGYPSMEEFIEGWTWETKWRKPYLNYNGGRHTYSMQQPIVEPGTHQLILNYYPTGTRRQQVHDLDNDTRLYTIVSATK